MRNLDQGLVEIVRDFVNAHGLMRNVIDRQRRGELRFDQLQELIGDDERSALFRLKEKCHALFRIDRDAADLETYREALFDLAVGSLFHEAMKFRENFYQREVYGPRVQALRSRARSGESAIFDEFDKILSAVSRRIDEGLQEAEKLLGQTVQQLRVLLAAHRANGLVSRYLIERSERVAQVFSMRFEDLLIEIYGSVSQGFELAGRSYLMSGYYDAALAALAEAGQQGADTAEIERLSSYARGMSAYLARDYVSCVEQLDRWAPASHQDPPQLRRLARDAVSRVGQLVAKEERERVGASAAALLAQLTSA